MSAAGDLLAITQKEPNAFGAMVGVVADLQLYQDRSPREFRFIPPKPKGSLHSHVGSQETLYLCYQQGDDVVLVPVSKVYPQAGVLVWYSNPRNGFRYAGAYVIHERLAAQMLA